MAAGIAFTLLVGLGVVFAVGALVMLVVATAETVAFNVRRWRAGRHLRPDQKRAVRQVYDRGY